MSKDEVLKKPVPLPRTKFETKKLEVNEIEDDNISDSSSTTGSRKRFGSGRNFMGKDWKAATEIIQGKGKLMLEASRTEVQKVKNVMMKRRSVHPTNSPDIVPKDYQRSNSLPCEEVFSSISFSSPLFEKNTTASSDCSDGEESYYSTSALPPPYPPPDLPDESTYDEVHTPSSGTYSVYEALSKYRSVQPNTSVHNETNSEISFQSSSNESKSKRSDSWSFYDSPLSDVTSSRYEDIEDSETNMSTNTDDNQSDILPSLNSPHCEIDFSSMFNMNETVLRPTKTSPGRNNVTQSVIVEFDPLFENKAQLTTISEVTTDVPLSPDTEPNLSELDETVPSYSNLDIKFPSPLVPPPIPPRRYDSITNNSVDVPQHSEEQPSTDVKLEDGDAQKTDTEKRKSGTTPWYNIREAVRKVTENFDNRTSWSPASGLIRRNSKKAIVSGLSSVNDVSSSTNESTFYSNKGNTSEIYSTTYSLNHCGVLYRPGGVHRWGQLLQRKLTIFAEKDSPEIKDIIPLDGFLSLQQVYDRRMGVDGKTVDCFELSVTNKNQCYVFGTPTPYDRNVWMRKILESVIMSFPSKLSSDYHRAGWCFMKEGVGGEWTTTSIMLRKRSLYLSPRNGSLQEADLRKARHFKLLENDSSYAKASERGPLILIDLPDKTLYLQMNIVRETLAWESVIVGAALSNGPRLCDQQLTKDNIPVIVDKCVNFIYTHGSLSEGIYRRSGSSTVVSKLLSLFSRDSWSVQLTRQEYTEYDIASVVKRFFRDLPDSLLTGALRPELCKLADTLTTTQDERIQGYKDILSKLPEINQATVRRLIGHLYFIHQQCDKNLMPVENLSAIWGPTLMHFQDDSTVNTDSANTQAIVVKDLISGYQKLFDVDKTELEREKTILSVLEKYHNSITNSILAKPSGDLKIWVYLHSKQQGNCVSLSITPTKLVSEVCEELAGKMNLASHELCLEEVISNNMYRLLHHSERVLDTVLRWSYWDEQDRRDNSLVVKKNDLLQELAPLMKPPVVVCEELKFADRRSKSFKNYLFEFSRAKLCFYKDKTCSVILREWRIEEVIWYVGHEPKRNPQTRWSITFLEKNNQCTRSKEEPYFGNTICGGSKEQQLKWMAAMLCGEYPNGVIPSPNLLD